MVILLLSKKEKSITDASQEEPLVPVLLQLNNTKTKENR